jgi:hypothetical protein
LDSNPQIPEPAFRAVIIEVKNQEGKCGFPIGRDALTLDSSRESFSLARTNGMQAPSSKSSFFNRKNGQFPESLLEKWATRQIYAGV